MFVGVAMLVWTIMGMCVSAGMIVRVGVGTSWSRRAREVVDELHCFGHGDVRAWGRVLRVRVQAVSHRSHPILLIDARIPPVRRVPSLCACSQS